MTPQIESRALPYGLRLPTLNLLAPSKPIHTLIYIYIYIHREGEREREIGARIFENNPHSLISSNKLRSKSVLIGDHESLQHITATEWLNKNLINPLCEAGNKPISNPMEAL